MKRAILSLTITTALAALLAGCETLDVITQVSTSVGVATGKISTQEADAINRTASAAGKAFEQITPEQEYYIGRAVTATILTDNKTANLKNATHYLNVLGQALAMHSDKPETFGGYHFAIMDTDEINAFAAPGGLILVSRGLLRCCRTEDAVAAVLAHEIGHVQLLHGLRAIRKSRLTSALTILAAESAKNLGGEQLTELTTAFEGSISDITGTLVNSGYSRTLESEADAAAITIMQRTGYNPSALKDMLKQMQARMPADDKGFGKTHPSPTDRIADITPLLPQAETGAVVKARQKRFEKAMKGV
ncbi:MAG: M48 family metallopeptidase [Kiritimatiellia bacterium]|jgi:predicted Zn-dependent protease|nr:M48 family metallopeptidase [Kiritimatiellia bacterium]MDP6629923.1 M48 family metallopeptidase [Kiritimatiellia bacterium]MDP6810121.1 M48 family metallopeptidase [Kiritimatiellia bacterium]MDP7023661.1 M48 family metallopeptidase [Kiritimatiellia bacterium]